jgi:hypothetical protein
MAVEHLIKTELRHGGKSVSGRDNRGLMHGKQQHFLVDPPWCKQARRAAVNPGQAENSR